MLGKLKTEAVQSLVGYSVSLTGLEPAIFGFGVRSVSTLRQCIEFKKERFCCSAAAFPASLSARSEALMLSHPLIALYIKLSISAVILLWAKCQICHLRFELVWRMIFFITSIWFGSEQRWNQELTELTDSLVSDWRSPSRESKMSVLELSLRHSSWSRVQICLQTWELLELWAQMQISNYAICIFWLTPMSDHCLLEQSERSQLTHKSLEECARVCCCSSVITECSLSVWV